MNEIRDLIVGIDFGKEYSQICYYDRKGDEARSLSMKAGGNQYEAPCILCWRPEQKDYCVGLEADYFVREKGGDMRNICCWIMGKAFIIMFSRRKEKPGTAVWDGMPLHRRTCLFAR